MIFSSPAVLCPAVLCPAEYGKRPKVTSSRMVSFIWMLLVWVRMASRLDSSLLFHWPMSLPAKSTVPPSRAISREIIPMTVDLPAPLGPMRLVTLPLGISKLTESTTVLPSYFLIKSVTFIIYTLLLVRSRYRK